ncbi:MAG: serine/threonine protein kinase [Deltaproteobacteria bacterium]|nr:serine/threonine protein kinase [Deltaproteobacteria bacterium]
MSHVQAKRLVKRPVRLPLPTAPLGGRYELLAELGAGGMGKVLVARTVGAAGFQRLFAVKVLQKHLADEGDFVTMFLDEARLAARIHHANVVPTLDIGGGPDGHFIVMDYVEGDSLAGLVERSRDIGTRLPMGVALRIVLDALEGLHAAHEVTGDDGQPLHLVHRDVSPDNLLVGVDGVSRLTDFGVARARNRLHTTRDPRCKGKHAYMSPEQILASRDVDRRADVYGMGVLLWECLVGERLFAARKGEPTYERVLREPIREPRSVDPSVPQALSDVVMKALERDRSRRYATAAALAAAIDDAAARSGVAIARPSAVGQLVMEISGDKVYGERRRVRVAIERSRRRAEGATATSDGVPVMLSPWTEEPTADEQALTIDRTSPAPRTRRPVTMTVESPSPFRHSRPPEATTVCSRRRTARMWMVGLGGGVLFASAVAVLVTCLATA